MSQRRHSHHTHHHHHQEDAGKPEHAHRRDRAKTTTALTRIRKEDARSKTSPRSLLKSTMGSPAKSGRSRRSSAAEQLSPRKQLHSPMNKLKKLQISEDSSSESENEKKEKKKPAEPIQIAWQGKLYYCQGKPPIAARDWKSAWCTLKNHKLLGVVPDRSGGGRDRVVIDWAICIGCCVERSTRHTNVDRSNWGYVFSLECQETGVEVYFVAESEEIGAKWVQKIHDARFLTHWLAPWDRDVFTKYKIDVEECGLLQC